MCEVNKNDLEEYELTEDDIASALELVEKISSKSEQVLSYNEKAGEEDRCGPVNP